MSAPILAVDSVHHRFGRRVVLAGAWLEARPGRVTALLGRNGAGKTTLLHAMAGLRAADQGSLRWEGEAILRPRYPLLARRGLWALLADRTALAESMTLGAQLRMVAARFGGDAEGAAARFGVAARMGDRPASLSGGERRRAELALAWARRPRCLLADEPFRGLNPADADRLADDLRALAAAGAAVVVTGHELTYVRRAADDVVWLTDGGTRYFATPARAFDDGTFRRDFLGAGPASLPTAEDP